MNEVVPFLQLVVTAMVPFILAAQGTMIAGRAGVFNVAQEGLMMLGASVGFLISLKMGGNLMGLLVAAPSVGALAVMLLATRRPPGRGAGRTLLLAVAGFGVSMIVFGLSHNLALSVLALVAAGVFDGISMVIRSATLQLNTPDHMRGRVNAVSGMFIGASNELGAFESGIAARLLGTARSVWLGGIVTLIVVAATAALAPELRAMNLTDIED